MTLLQNCRPESSAEGLQGSVITRGIVACRLDGYHLPATLLRRLGRRAKAAVSYRHALDLAVTDAECGYRAGRLAESGSGSGSGG
jgi:predicted RNA polymerase sigma factor